jgi:hypothetical protein
VGVGRHRHRVPQLGEQFQIKKMIGLKTRWQMHKIPFLRLHQE